MKKNKVILGSDHAGYKIKEKLKGWLNNKYQVIDLSINYKKGDDYPDYAFKVGEKVAKIQGKGILICKTGAGMVMAANKVKGIRAVEAYDAYTARLSREHNDANILSLSGRHLSFDKIKQIANLWLTTPFSGAQRHKRRLKKISDYEDKR